MAVVVLVLAGGWVHEGNFPVLALVQLDLVLALVQLDLVLALVLGGGQGDCCGLGVGCLSRPCWELAPALADREGGGWGLVPLANVQGLGLGWGRGPGQG